MSEKAQARKFNRSNLRRLIRARAYTSISQIRRYFSIESEDVNPIHGPNGMVFVALPEASAGILSQLWREGKIDVQLSPDVRAAIIDGVYSTESPVRLD